MKLEEGEEESPGQVRTPFDKKYMRYSLLIHKDFLKSLYYTKNAKDASLKLKNCTSRQLDILIKVMYLQVQHGIPLNEEDVEKLSPFMKKRILARFKNLKDVTSLLKSQDKVKRSFLSTFSSAFRHLLKPLFIRNY